MIKANELRIGNYIQRDDKHLEVDSEIIRNFEELDMILIYKYSPIPLTEEWLMKFGFDGCKAPNGKIKVGLDGMDFVNNEITLVYEFSHWKLKYVHQLQNLYFALTGEELNINHC